MKKIILFSLLVLISCTFGWSQCASTVTISGVYPITYTGSNSWIASSGITTIPTGANVTLDANPLTNGYVLLDTGFETQPSSTFLAIVQTPCAAFSTTQIQSSQCGSALPTLATTILCNWYSGASDYRFRITQLDMITNLPIAPPLFKDRNINNVALSNVPGIIYNAKYSIDIDVKVGGVWLNTYGPACTVTTPNPVSTIGAQCGTTLTAMNQWIYTTYVPFVPAYRFRVTELDASLLPVGTPKITSPDPITNKFNMTQLTGILYGTTYRVEVALKNLDGTFLPYNVACNITTPPYPTTQLIASQCTGFTATSGSQFIYCNVVSGASNYMFRLFDGVTYTTPYINGLNRFKLNNFVGLSPSATYTVEVAVKLTSEPGFGPYGSICTINSPAVFKKDIEKDSALFEAVAYPNPFTESFNLDIKTASESTIQIRVYDMIGKLIENRECKVSDIENVNLGLNYASGVYNIIVSQDDKVETIRMIRR